MTPEPSFIYAVKEKELAKNNARGYNSFGVRKLICACSSARARFD